MYNIISANLSLMHGTSQDEFRELKGTSLTMREFYVPLDPSITLVHNCKNTKHALL